MTKSNNGGPAFPVSSIDGFTQYGMSLRDWFAGQALAGLVAYNNPAHAPRAAYAAADAMLAERAKGGSE